jgi:hypothetical protein
MSQWDFTGPPPGQRRGFGEYDEYGEFHEYTDSAGPGDPDSGYSDDFEGGAFSPISYERDPYEPPWEPAPAPPRPLPDESWPPRLPRHRRPARPRWLMPAAVVAVIAAGGGAAVVLLGAPSGHTSAGGQPTATRPATTPATGVSAPAAPQPLTLAQAKSILATYTSTNNTANAHRSDSLLAGIETGSSYAIDAGIYRVQQAEKAAAYPAFAPAQERFYIPGEPVAAYPHWFAVQVGNAELASPGKVTATEYLVFTQTVPGGQWLNAMEPYVLAAAATPQVALGADGLATAINTGSTSLAIAPTQIGAMTATALDGGQSGAAGTAALASPANQLADRVDQAFWKHRLPSATVTDRHAIGTGGEVFGLRTADGGALLFYTDAAELTLVPPAGEALHLTIPGFYSAGQALSTAGVGYLEQFATYVPPRGGSGLRVVADYSGITEKN